MTRDEMEAESTWIIKEWEDRPANHVPTALELAAVRLARSLTAPAAEPADDPSLRMRIVRWLHTKADEFGQMEPPKRRTAESGWPQMLLHNIANEIFITFAQPVAPTEALPTPGTPAGSINVEFEVDCEGRVHPVEAAAMLRTVAVPTKCPDCGHQPHKPGPCYNMASDNDCNCGDAAPAGDAADELERLRGEVLARDQWARDVSMYYEMPYEGPDLFATIAIFLRRQRALLAETQHAAK